MMSKNWIRRAVAAPKSNTGRTANRFAPKFVQLEQRDVPAIFYVDPALAGSNPGDTVIFNAGNPTQVTGLTFGTDAFDTFQAAYNQTTANGTADTIELAYGTIPIDNSAGTYVVTPADGALSIVGSGAGATTITPTNDTAAEFGSDAAIFRADGAGATLNVSSLNLDGGAPALLIGQGFRYENGATGAISKISASLVIYTSIGDNSGSMVVALGAGTNVTVSGSTFTDYGAVAVGVDQGATATITGSVFNGGGPGSYIITGVQVSDGSTATISGNTFTSHLGQENGAISSAILLSGDDGSGNFTAANATIIGNTISNNVAGVIVGTPDASNAVVDPSNAIIEHNNITSNNTGILAATTAVVDAKFNWWGDASGPLAVGNLTAAGDNPNGKGNPVDTQVLWQDATITPDGSVLQGPTPVISAASSAAYIAALPVAHPLVSAPSAPLVPTALPFTVTFDQPVNNFDAADITVTNGTISSVVDSGDHMTYTVTVAQTAAGNVSVSVPASMIGADGLPTIRTAAFGGSAASNTATATFTSSAFANGFSASGDSGQSQPVFGVNQNFDTSSGIIPFESTFTGGVRSASADINGDGILDIIVGSGPGRENEVKIYDGATGALIADFHPFETTFTGGVFVTAGDVNLECVAEVVVTPDVTGGPRVRVLNGATIKSEKLAFTGSGPNSELADFFGIADSNFRGGARAAVGDINGDGFGDIIVAAGFGGGPRIAGFSGNGISSTTQVKLFGDFFAFSPTDSGLRDGAYVAVGDVNGDGFADVVAGSGDGGAPRVSAYSGKDLLNNTQTFVANFFAGSVTGGINNRGGVRVAVKDLDQDGKADIINAPGQGRRFADRRVLRQPDRPEQRRPHRRQDFGPVRRIW